MAATFLPLSSVKSHYLHVKDDKIKCFTKKRRGETMHTICLALSTFVKQNECDLQVDELA